MTATTFLLGALASWRIAALVATDTITMPFRSWVARRYTAPDVTAASDAFDVPPSIVIRTHPFVTLVYCVKCLGVWTSLATFALMHAAGIVPDRAEAVLGAVAAAGVVSLTARFA